MRVPDLIRHLATGGEEDPRSVARYSDRSASRYRCGGIGPSFRIDPVDRVIIDQEKSLRRGVPSDGVGPHRRKLTRLAGHTRARITQMNRVVLHIVEFGSRSPADKTGIIGRLLRFEDDLSATVHHGDSRAVAKHHQAPILIGNQQCVVAGKGLGTRLGPGA